MVYNLQYKKSKPNLLKGVRNSRVKRGGYAYGLDLSDEPSGTYLLRFINGEQVKNRKIVLQK